MLPCKEKREKARDLPWRCNLRDAAKPWELGAEELPAVPQGCAWAAANGRDHPGQREIEKFQGSEGKKDDEDKKYLDVISNKNIKLSERVLIPVKQYPKFNFVGKLLGPRGNSLKRLQEETGAKMSILGKGSMRDKAKEEELRKSGEAKYAHLSDELHVLIEVFAPPGEAYSRMSHALEEIKKFLVPEVPVYSYLCTASSTGKRAPAL
nr:PREDICTED: KH domain-containing, RNA-binding, signal transduction-associated protein 2-like [Opisthocomus hoazin]